ncbi:MAG: tripartite tricarboxylate transporter substrate binding protein [Nocardioides sp.]|uniref:Bug family tripartite tricarboxylate transporter substrate binding protein n=1 Tax=Nocardioides sp. TaxID=35761 RepID=UPI00326379D5
MRKFQKLAATGAALAAVLALAACSGSDDSAQVRIMVPNSPGGGYDTTARVAAKIVEDEKINDSVEVYNLEGAGGTTGLAKLVGSKGKDGELMLMGLGVVGAVYTNQSESTLADTTPIARLISEPDIVVVPADSPYETLDDLIAAWKKSPGDFPVGGGSSPGGPDHLAAHLTAQAIGVTPTDVNYVVYDGGGPLLAAMLSGEVEVGVSGLGEYKDQIQAGQLRVLGVTSAERVDGFEAPTLTEQGVDLEFTNWRGLVAAPGIDDAERDRLVGIVEDLHDTQAWKDAMAENGWTDALLTGDEFGTYMTDQDGQVKGLLSELGLV